MDKGRYALKNKERGYRFLGSHGHIGVRKITFSLGGKWVDDPVDNPPTRQECSDAVTEFLKNGGKIKKSA